MRRKKKKEYERKNRDYVNTQNRRAKKQWGERCTHHHYHEKQQNEWKNEGKKETSNPYTEISCLFFMKESFKTFLIFGW